MLFKKLFIICLAVCAMFIFAGCGDMLGNKEAKNPALEDRYKNEVDPILIGEEEVSPEDFLIENLKNYLESENYLKCQQNFQDIMGGEPIPFEVTRVTELALTKEETSSIDIHFLAVKANYYWADENGNLFSEGVLIADYETGMVYDQSMVDESWFETEGTKDAYVYIMFNCSFVDAYYDGGTILNANETRTELSAESIARINEAIHK